jgi:hypothetical protein
MAADSPYRTLGNIESAIFQDAKETTSTDMVSLVRRYINEGHEHITNRKKRDWLDTQYTYQVNAAVEDTCTVTNGSVTVTFEDTSTTFPTGVELQFNNQGYEEIYNVVSATLNVVTLDKPYLGDTSTAATGVVYQPHLILDSEIRDIYQVYHNHTDQPLTAIGPQEMRRIQEGSGVQRDFASYYSVFGQDSSGSRRLVLYPYPDEDYTLYLDVNIFIPMLSDTDDEPVLPMQFRQALYWYGLYRLWLYHRNMDQAAVALTNYNGFLKRIDGEIRSEVEFPQIVVSYPRRQPLRTLVPGFDKRLRDD